MLLSKSYPFSMYPYGWLNVIDVIESQAPVRACEQSSIQDRYCVL